MQISRKTMEFNQIWITQKWWTTSFSSLSFFSLFLLSTEFRLANFFWTSISLALLTSKIAWAAFIFASASAKANLFGATTFITLY